MPTDTEILDRLEQEATLPKCQNPKTGQWEWLAYFTGAPTLRELGRILIEEVDPVLDGEIMARDVAATAVGEE